MKRELWAPVLLFVGVGLCAGCAFFSRPLPLPRRAAIETTGTKGKFSALIEDADIIYFPSESAALGKRSEAAWKLLEAMERNSSAFAIGWDSIGDDAESDRAFLAETKKSGARILAINIPAHLSADEVSDGFEPPAGNFARFARRPSFRGLSEATVRAAYEAALLAEEFVAAKIAGYFAEHRNEKILMFLRRDQLGRDHGVPYFVAQKTRARQLVLDPQRPSPPGARLLARNRIWSR